MLTIRKRKGGGGKGRELEKLGTILLKKKKEEINIK